MLSTKFQQAIFLGFAAKEALQQITFEDTFVGGKPVFLKVPPKGLLSCSDCHEETLTFIGQLYCPLEQPRSYNRVLYMFYCEKCQHNFRCMKQQSRQQQDIKEVNVEVRTLGDQSYAIESDDINVKQLMKIINRARLEVEEEILDEEMGEAEEQDDEGEDIKQDNIQMEKQRERITKELAQFEFDSKEDQLMQVKEKAQIQKPKQKKDIIFEQYRKIMAELASPVLLYGNVPLPYNEQPINPRHFCKHCNAKLVLQLQLSSQLLLLSPKLMQMDWGSFMVFTCNQSCDMSVDEFVVIQYEIDAIKEAEVSKLRHKHKKDKKRAKKSQSKGKNPIIPEQKHQRDSSEEHSEKVPEGDWD